MRLVKQLCIAVLVIYFSWMLMLLTHELGHVVHSLLSSGKVVAVSIPLLGFSQTVVDPNPRALLVVWGGPIWGVGIPLLLWILCRRARSRWSRISSFFAGFALIANGLYIGLGPLIRAGDSRDMLRLGTPPSLMMLFGLTCTVTGLLLWHRNDVLRDFYFPCGDTSRRY